MGKAGGPVAPNDERDSGKEHRKLTAHLSFSARDPNTKSLPASETAVAPEPVAAVSFLQGSRWFAPLDATPSLHSCPRGQARSCLHWGGGGNIGRSRVCATRLHRMGAWTATRQRAESVVRSSQGLFCGH